VLAPLLAAEALAIAAGGGPGIDRERIFAESRRFAANGGRLLRLGFESTDWLCYGSVVVLLTAYEFEVAAATGARTVQRGRATELFVHRGGRWWNTDWHLDSRAAHDRRRSDLG
jgi:hypothetical protein